MSEKTKTQNPSLIGMIINPLRQFERIREKPLIWRAIIIVTVLTTIGFLLKIITETSIAGTTGLTIIAATRIIVRIAVMSYLYMLISTFAPLSTVNFKQLFSMNTYISILFAINEMINGILTFTGNNSTNLEIIIYLFFSIWITILTAFGLQITAKFPQKLAWFVALVFIIIESIYVIVI